MNAASRVKQIGASSRELKIFAWMAGAFLLAYFLPLSDPRITAAVQEAFKLLQWYARNHTLACVVPALFSAGAVYFSNLIGADAKAAAAKVSVTDWASSKLIPATSASFLYGLDANSRPTVKAFADQATAAKEQQASPGNLLTWDGLRSKELAARCAFCDRAVYPEDACAVKFGTTHGYGCCTHCAMGVAARLQQDIEVEAKDGRTGEPIRVKTLDGQIASLEPKTAIAWFGQKKSSEGKWISAGCFKQGFFVNEGNLQKWLAARPAMTGREITIAQALADKLKLTPEQIAKACKLGECK